jgi:tetratricopeptide (TPR) repeat protein
MRLKHTLTLFRILFCLAGIGLAHEHPICISLIVKNNESTIGNCLKSVQEVASCISVCDMGSTDQTKELIETFFAATGIPGKIYPRESQDVTYYPIIGATAAQKTLKSFGFALSKSYLLTLEPDQILSADSHLTEKLIDDSYLLLERSSLLSCYSYTPHLFRASLSPEEIGNKTWSRSVKKMRAWVLDDPEPLLKKPDVDMTEEEEKKWFKDQQEQYKKDKLTQNIELYKESLKNNPENSKALLNLAHSYKSLKQYDEAIQFYRKCMEQGEDKETVWLATYRIGECQEEMNVWIHALYWYLEAYNYDPSRAEPLRKIATYYRSQGQSDLAYIFAKHGWRIPKPGSETFLPSPPLCDYQFDEEISIAAYYTRFKEEGYAASSDLLLRKDTPYHIREQGYKNLLFYIQNIKARYIPISIPLPLVNPESDELYHPMNPSILKTESGYKLICRSVNYTQTGAKHFHTNDPNGIFRTRNFLVHYDRSFKKMGHHEIIEDLDREHCRAYIVQGLEDCRLFAIDGASWFTCSTWDTNPAGAIQISLCKMKEGPLEKPVKVEKLIPLKGPDPNRHEKNWLPFLKNGELLFVYSSDPFILLSPDVKTGDMTTLLEHPQTHDFSRFRGSAAPIEFDDGYLMLIHEVIQFSDYTRAYIHRFVFLDADFIVKKVSKPFTYKHTGIEYCLSMTIDHEGKHLVMPIGIEDNEAFLAFVDLDEVRSLLQPLPTVYPSF